MQLSDVEKEVLAELAARVRSRFGERVRLVALFGSRARGDAHQESDIDVCVVIDELSWRERQEISFIAGELLDHRDVLVSPFALSTEHMNLLRARERLIAAEIDREGILL